MRYFGLHWSDARSKRTRVRLAQRAPIVLLAAQGLQNKDIAERLGIGRDLPRGAPPVNVDVAKWVERTACSPACPN